MAKLYFRYGAMNSAKTLNLLAVAHNYEYQGKKVVLVKPALDIRFGEREIRSRAGLLNKADFLVRRDTVFDENQFEGAHCILVDEAQFLSNHVVEQFREISWKKNIPVICYGLRTDFKSRLFEGSKRLLELADTIEEIKTTCSYCNKKAIMNLKHVNGRAISDGPSIELGADEKYSPACYQCYVLQIEETKKLQTELRLLGNS